MKIDHADELARLLELYAADIPTGEREYRFHPTRLWRFDKAWPSHKFALEVDGGQWAQFGGRHATDADREKGNEAAALGWRVLHVSPVMLRDDPGQVFDWIRRALAVIERERSR